MSQPPNSQPPLPEPESQNSATPRRQVNAQTQGNTLSTVLKTQTIKFLRGTIRVLEGVVVKLEAQPGQTTQPNWFDKVRVSWSGVLGKIRSLLPQNLSSLSDTALTSIIAIVSVILVWTTSSVLSRKPSEVVATAPPDIVSTPTIPTPPDIEPTPSPVIPTPPDNIEPTPSPTIPTPPDNIEPTPSPVIPTPPDIEPTPTIPTPPQLTAPAEPQPVDVTPEPEPEPEATVELTPEQTLIAAIENQVALVSDRIANGLIKSIQANFEGSSLTLKVTNDWYNLKPSEQDKLATQMLERSKELDFTRLEITDSQGTLLARSPVVGKDMVIFKRSA